MEYFGLFTIFGDNMETIHLMNSAVGKLWHGHYGVLWRKDRNLTSSF
jgi:hypothetical protein